MKHYRVEKLTKIFNECDKHLLRLNSAYSKIVVMLPFDANTYSNLNENEIEHIDQYLFRFAKLQDAMGEKLFRAILLFLDEEIEGKPFVDVLNTMEKLSILASAEAWRKLRDIRNELSHQYDDEPEEMSIVLNKILSEKNQIEGIYKRIKAYYDEKLYENSFCRN